MKVTSSALYSENLIKIAKAIEEWNDKQDIPENRIYNKLGEIEVYDNVIKFGSYILVLDPDDCYNEDFEAKSEYYEDLANERYEALDSICDIFDNDRLTSKEKLKEIKDIVLLHL